ncbi:hypothetical protein [Adlercreutzia caecimuris]|uniref:hypothetical protein n=1 Tax=Adlercreutzia caecimuris TaxID=671266 RepID=UPI001C3EEB84|nr:hypothetical protein [Adlercreutzia caecimuris]
MAVTVSDLTLKRVGGDSRDFYASWGAPKGKNICKKALNSKGKTVVVGGKKGVTRAAATANYEVAWAFLLMLSNGKTRWSSEQSRTTSLRNMTFTAPDNAIKVKVKARPLSKTYTVYKKVIRTTGSGKNKKTKVTYEKSSSKPKFFTPAWSSKDAWTDEKSVIAPAAPDLSVSGDLAVTAKVEANDPYPSSYEMALDQLLGGRWARVSAPSAASAEVSHSFYVPGLRAGCTYRAAARTARPNGKWSPWSPWSDTVLLRPPAPARPAMASRVTGVLVSWAECQGASEYEVALAESKSQLDSSSQRQTETTAGTAVEFAVDRGKSYYARVRAKNDTGSGPWSPVAGPLVHGTRPDPPTAWGSAGAVVRGGTYTISWEHNSTDSSEQTQARVWANTGAGWFVLATLGAQKFLDVDTSAYPDGTTLRWYVVTKGVLDEFSKPSETMAVGIWEQPTLALAVPSTVTALPVTVEADPSSPTQVPVAADVAILACSDHAVDLPDGTQRHVVAGEAAWSVHLDRPGDPFSVPVGAGDVSLASGQSYRLSATVAMSSGLTCSASVDFDVEFEPVDLSLSCDLRPNGEWGCEVVPYALEEADDGVAYAPDVALSVYRHETDGSMTPLVRNMPNDGSYSYVDGHASFGLASYRAVATVLATGQVEYIDVAEDVIEFEGILIQWGSESAASEDDEVQVLGAAEANCLALTDNIKVSDDYDPDTGLVEYIGRKHPVAYHGTQLGHTANWQCTVDKGDAGKVELLREIARLGETVFVREPLGDHYWAHVVPSWSASADSGLISVALAVTRVDRSDECVVMP